MLLAQVCGVVVLLWIFTRPVRARTQSSAREAFGIAAVGVPAVLATVVAVISFWPDNSGMVSETRQDSRLTGNQAAVAGSITAGARADFFSWVSKRLPANATFYLIDYPEVSLWATYQLTPRRSVMSIDDAQWLVLYGVSPTAAGQGRLLFGPELTYAPGFGIARRR